MTDKEWVELCNERHIKVVDFDYRNCTRDKAIAAINTANTIFFILLQI